MKQRVIAIKCSNHSGVINRITALFFARSLSINSLISSETQEANHYEIFVELTYSKEKVQFIVKLLDRLIDVIEVSDITEDIHIERQHTLIKLKSNDLKTCTTNFHNKPVRVIDIKDGYIYLELTDSINNTNDVIESLKELGAVEYVRAGRLFLK